MGCECGVRRDPDAESRRLLEAYFLGMRCVVDGGDNAQWHHLDDDKSNARFEDFVPIGCTWNIALRDSRRRGGTEVPADLNPDQLANKAAFWQSSWDVSRAYGLSRLAYYVGRLYTGKSTDQLLLYAAGTLRYLRHRPSYRLIHDVVLRDILPLTSELSRVSAYSAIRVLLEIACLYGEHDEAGRAHEVHRILSPRLRSRYEGDSWYANARRRADIAAAVVEDTPEQAVARLLRAVKRAPNETGIRVGCDTFSALHLFGAGKHTKARGILEPHCETIVPSLANYADAVRHTNRKAMPPLNVSLAAHFLQAYAVVHGATEGDGPRARARADEYERILAGSFYRSGALIQHEVPFSWHSVLPGRHLRICPPLSDETLRLLDRTVGNLVAIFR